MRAPVLSDESSSPRWSRSPLLLRAGASVRAAGPYLFATGAAFIPGALAGVQIAGLLFFLNHHLPFESVLPLRAALYYGLLLGMGSLVLLLPFTWNHPNRARRLLPWTLTLVLTTVGLIGWYHASHYAFFLPPGINQRLLKMASLVSLAAIIAFYTALLHSINNRPYSIRSRGLFVFLALASIYVTLERREAFKPRIGPGPRPTTVQSSARPLLLVVGIEAATLDAILPLAERGRLPFFARMRREGSQGRLSSLVPVRRSPLWMTLATGKYPFQHGIVDGQLYAARFLPPAEKLKLLPAGIGFRHWGLDGESIRADSGERDALTLWEIFSRLGIATGVVGWPLTAPDQDGLSFSLSDRFFQVAEVKGLVTSREIENRALLFQTDHDEIDPLVVAAFGSEPSTNLLKPLAADLWRQTLSFFLLDQEPGLEAFFLMLPGLREVSEHYFGAYAAVQFDGTQDPVSIGGEKLLSAYYAQLDAFLSELWERTQPPRLLVVVSAHGAEPLEGWGELKSRMLRRSALEGTTDRGSDGVLLFLGEGVQSGVGLEGANLVDLVPTILYGMGFPIARDFDGVLLKEVYDTAFLARHPLTFVPSYETLTATP